MNLTWIKKVYLYLVSLISLIILIIAGIILLNTAFSTWIFTKADENYYGYIEPPYCGDSNPLPVEPAVKPEMQAEPAMDLNASSEEQADIAIYRDPRCDDSDWEAKQKQQEQDRKTARNQSQASSALAMILVTSPVFYYHWKLARKEA
ncbi:MAG: hypothetical protein R3B41_04220 [Candidatus Doudnabacteria bacterium]